MNSNQNSRIKLLKLFKKEATEFVDELIDQFEDDSHLVMAKIFIETQLPIEELMQTFIAKILPHKEMVEERNEKFFLEHDVSFFGGDTTNNSHMLKFKKMWLELDPDAKLAVWQWFDLFVNLSQKYKDLM